MKKHLFTKTAGLLFKKIFSGILLLALSVSSFGAGIFLPTMVAHADSSPVTLFSDGFESGDFSLWSQADTFWSVDATVAHEGTHSALVTEDMAGSSKVLRKAISTAGHTSVELSYWYIAEDLEDIDLDDVRVQYSIDGGESWVTPTLNVIDDSVDDRIWHISTHAIDVTAANNPNFQFRFMAHLDDVTDKVWIDEVKLTATAIVTDFCPNIDGTQTTLPEGMMFSEGNCVAIPSEETPPTPLPAPTPTPEGGGSATFDYWGCTDTTAPNFNALANKDDGSCVHPEVLGVATTTNTGGDATTTPELGEVLGAATTTDALPEGCGEYIKDYLKYGKKNNPEEVKKLQSFLNETLGANIPLTGFFGKLTRNFVKQFQSKYHDEIIKPWKDAGYKGKDIEQGSGYVYKTTKRKINLMKCASLNTPLPDLKGEVQ